MKKILFGSGAAILAVVGFSAFTAPHQAKALKQYIVVSNVNVGAQIQSGSLVELLDDQTISCSGANIHYCIVTINSSSVNAAQTKVTIATTPQTTFQTRN